MFDRCERSTALVPLARNHARLIEVVPGERKPIVRARTVQSELGAGLLTVAKHGILPVRRDVVLDGVLLLGREEPRDARVLAVRGSRVLHVRHVLLEIHHRDELHRLLHPVVGVCRVRRLNSAPSRTLLRRHEDDAVGASASVDRRRRRVLEHLDGLDHLRVEVLDTARDRDAVDDVQGVVARRERPDAANANVHRRARLVARRDDLDAGDSALQRLHRVVGRNLSQLLRRNRGDRASDCATVRFVVARHDDRIERRGRGLQREVRGCSSTGRHRHRGGARPPAERSRRHRVRSGGGVHDRVAAPCVGQCATRRADQNHLHVRNRSIALGRCHPSGDPPTGLRLSSGHRGEHGEYRKEDPASHQSYLRRA